MKIRHILLLLLKQLNNKIDSKTKLQKLLYFLSLKLSRNFGYSPYFYGPYSSTVESALDELISAGFVEAKREVFGVDTKKGFEVKRYSFELTKDGRDFVSILNAEDSIEMGKIKDLVDKLNSLGSQDYLSLSIAAKSYYILSHFQEPMSINDIKSKAKEFNWEIDKDDINKAISILEKLDFIKN